MTLFEARYQRPPFLCRDGFTGRPKKGPSHHLRHIPSLAWWIPKTPKSAFPPPPPVFFCFFCLGVAIQDDLREIGHRDWGGFVRPSAHIEPSGEGGLPPPGLRVMLRHGLAPKKRPYAARRGRRGRSRGFGGENARWLHGGKKRRGANP